MTSCSAEEGAEQWSPTYCIERPRSIFAVLANCSLPRWPQETSPLLRPPPPVPVVGRGSRPVVPRIGTGGSLAGLGRDSPAPPNSPVSRRREELATIASRSLSSRACGLVNRCCGVPDAVEQKSEPQIMSPRVMHIIDDFNFALNQSTVPVVDPRRSIHSDNISARPVTSMGLSIYLYQERKITLVTTVQVNTVALVIAAIVVVVNNSVPQLAARLSWLLFLRVTADVLACVAFQKNSTNVPAAGLSLLWSRHGLLTVHGWLYYTLVAGCAVVVVLAGRA